MILLHEEMQNEAAHLAPLVETVFRIPVRPVADDLERFFRRLTMVPGYFYLPEAGILAKEFPDAAVLLLTRRDIYYGEDSKDDQWAFGASMNDHPFTVVATARLMGHDSTPRTTLAIDQSQYLSRVSYLTLHELGHQLIANAPHQEAAFWVNCRTCKSDSLGLHCGDNSCSMYEVVDIKSPHPDEGYLRLGERPLYDAGLDEHLARLRRDWFCSDCQNKVVIPKSYLA